MSKHVYLVTRTVGQSFGTVGVVREVGSRRKLAESDKVRPFGFIHVALNDAEHVAAQHGWIVLL